MDDSPMMESNITLEQFVKIVENTRQAALYDLDSFDMFELHNPDKPIFSVLGVQLRCRDDEDACWVHGWLHHRLFLRFNPNLIKYLRDESYMLLQDDEPGQESAKDKLYWEVEKYKQVHNQMCLMYVAHFSLDCELIGVEWHLDIDPSQRGIFTNYHDFHRHPDKYMPISDSERYLMGSKDQLFFANNVELPYHPGDILYIDARPFGKPLYVVYGAETDGDLEHFEWTKQEYGYYKRAHFCFYMSEDRSGLDITALAGGSFTDYLPFLYAPLERIILVDRCDNPLFMKISSLLKEDPSLFYTWLRADDGHSKDEGMEYLFTDEE